MEVDQILTNSFGYARSGWAKVVTLGAVVFLPAILFLFVFLGFLFNNTAVIVIMGILGFILALVASFVFYGYLFRVIRATLAGANDLPNFDDWGDMLMGGLKVLIVNVIYGLIFGILAAIPFLIFILVISMVGGSVASSVLTGTGISTIMSYGFNVWVLYLAIIIMYLIMMVLGILFAIMVPMGIANMAYTGHIGSALSFSEIKRRIKSIRWIKAIVWVISISFVFTVSMVISYALGLLLIGIILIPILVIPFMGIFFARSVGLLYLND